ncbi:MAG: hypothetical protein AAGF82_13755 [Pseudomonadota bacterium]
MLKHSTSLGTLFGRSVCPLFLATALVIPPSAALAQDITIIGPETITNGDDGTGNPNLFDSGETIIIEETGSIETDEYPGIYAGSYYYFGANGKGHTHSDITIINRGRIETSGDSNNVGSGYPGYGFADGMYISRVQRAFIQNDGYISADDYFAFGIFLRFSDDSTIINNGTIWMPDQDDPAGSGDDVGSATRALGINASDNALVINNGTISEGSYGAEAAVSAYNSRAVTFINNGLIEVRTDAAETVTDTVGLHPTGTKVVDYKTAVMSGMRIHSYYDRLYETDYNGLLTDIGTDAEREILANWTLPGQYMENNGTIRSHVVGSHGMYIKSQDGGAAQIINNPDDLLDYNVSSEYIYLADSLLVNNGRIEMISTDLSGYSHNVSGMRMEGHDATLINNGYIHIKPNGYGMQNRGGGVEMYNYGTIVLDHNNVDEDWNPPSAGMYSFQERSTEIQKWVQIADPDVSYYLEIGRQDNSARNLLVNAGVIRVNNSRSAGIRIENESGHDVYNFGTIWAPNGYSLYLTGDDVIAGVEDRIYLMDGSILVGDVLMNRVSKKSTRFVLGDGYNGAVRFVTETVFGVQTNPSAPELVTSRNGYSLVNDTLFSFDMEGYSQQDQTTWSMVSMIQDAVDEGTATRPPAGDFAFNGDGGEGMSDKWAQMFAGWVRDPGDGAIGLDYNGTDENEGGFNGYTAGTIIGVNKPERSYFLGAAYSKVDSIDWMDNDTGYDTHSGTLFGGIATTLKDRFDLSLTAGVSYNHSNRELADGRVTSGIDTVSADYASVFLSPSVLVEGPIGSSLRLNYLGGWTQGHSYKLSGGELLKVEQRHNHVVGAKFEMVQNIPKFSDRFRARFRYGAEASYADGADIASDVTLSGFTKQASDMSTPYDNGFSAGGFAALDIGPAFIKAGFNSDEQVSVNAGLTLRF